MRQNAIATARARALRQRQTAAETCLWQHLRGGRLLGLKVRRQVPLGPFIVDFLIPAARLAIELDGGPHAASAIRAADGLRDAWLAGEGYRVLRFWNSDIHSNLPGVLARIAEACR